MRLVLPLLCLWPALPAVDAADALAPAVNLAQVLALQGELPRARELLEGAREQDPEDPWALYNLAYVLQRQGQTGQAEALYRETLRQAVRQRMPHPVLLGARVHNNLGVLWAKQGRLTQAEQAFAQASLLRPGDRESALNAGLLALQRGDLDAARQRFDAVLRRHPQDELARCLRADLDARRGDLYAATEGLALRP